MLEEKVMLRNLSKIAFAAALTIGAAAAVSPASAAPAGATFVVSPKASIVDVQYRPHYIPPRRVCRWDTVRVRGPYGRWVTKRVQRCVVRR
jgi:hypothetical protein